MWRDESARRWVAQTTRIAAGGLRPGESPPGPVSEAAEEEVTRLLMRHRLAALVYDGHEEGRIGALSDSLADLCREVWCDTLRRNWAALDVAEGALVALAEAGVPAAPVGVMAQLCSPDPSQAPALRPAPRWRLVVETGERQRAAAALRGLGLERVTSDRAEPWVLQRRLGRHELRLALHATWSWRRGWRRRGCCAADHFLKWHCRHDGRGFWPRVEPHLLLQCGWAVQGGLRRGIWLFDLDREIRCRKPEWTRFVALARRAGLTRQAWLALDATRSWFGSPIPPEILDALAPHPWVRRRLPVLPPGADGLAGSGLARGWWLGAGQGAPVGEGLAP